MPLWGTYISICNNRSERSFEDNFPIVPLSAFGLHHGVLCKIAHLLDKAKSEDEIQKLPICTHFADGTLSLRLSGES